jgi:hypothetical protein
MLTGGRQAVAKKRSSKRRAIGIKSIGFLNTMSDKLANDPLLVA